MTNQQDELAATFTYTLNADSGYTEEGEARISPEQYGQIVAIINSKPDLIESLKRENEGLRDGLRECADALAYVAFNYEDMRLEDLAPNVVESTSAAVTALIAERRARYLLASGQEGGEKA